MKEYVFQIIIWMPRILALLVVFVLSLFATESLNSYGPIGGRIFELCLQLCPAAIVLALSIFSWQHPGYGAYLFTLLGIVFLLYFKHESLSDFLLISGPLFLTAIFFLFSKLITSKQEMVNSK